MSEEEKNLYHAWVEIDMPMKENETMEEAKQRMQQKRFGFSSRQDAQSEIWLRSTSEKHSMAKDMRNDTHSE